MNGLLDRAVMLGNSPAMNPSATRGLLGIGEFSAATQLSLKALRIYDESRVLRPVSVAASGYRFYSREQIATGRLVRRLREMEIPLATIAEIVSAPAAVADALLDHCARQVDQRYARQKRAFQAGLALLHRAAVTGERALETGSRPAMTVVVSPVETTRSALLQTLRACRRDTLAQAAGTEPFCWLVEPLTEEPSRLDVAVPVSALARVPAGAALRELPAVPCVLHTMPGSEAPDIEAALDAMFDWLDRRGLRACEAPSISLRPDDVSLQLAWPHEPAAREQSP